MSAVLTRPAEARAALPRAAGVRASALAFLARDARVAWSYRIGFVMNVAAIAMSMVTFRFISKMVVGAKSLEGIGDYFAFVVIGMAMAQVLEGALSAPAGAVRQEQVQGTLEVLAATPLTPSGLAAGWLVYPLVQSVLTALTMLAIASPLGLHLGAHPDWAGALVVFVLSALAFAGLGIAGAAVVLVAQQAAQLTKWVTAGLALLSGVFFPLALFPHWVGVVAEASPLTHSLRALRAALLKGAAPGTLLPDLAAIAAFATIVLPLSIGALSLALRRARRTGSIATY